MHYFSVHPPIIIVLCFLGITMFQYFSYFDFSYSILSYFEQFSVVLQQISYHCHDLPLASIKQTIPYMCVLGTGSHQNLTNDASAKIKTVLLHFRFDVFQLNCCCC